jgi:hypothetical protein
MVDGRAARANAQRQVSASASGAPSRTLGLLADVASDKAQGVVDARGRAGTSSAPGASTRSAAKWAFGIDS